MTLPVWNWVGNRLRFVLRDDFLDTLAAGSVNGTLATPGGMGTTAQKTRTVTDTNNKISLGSGVLNAATGAASSDAVRWGVQTRVLGKMVVISSTPASATPVNHAVGWDNDTSLSLSDGVRFHATGALQVITNGVIIALGVYTAVPYSVAVVMRATGAYFFIKGGAFTYWTLLYVGTAGSGNLYPIIQSMFTASVYTADFLRIPLSTAWIPTPVAYDAFGRANGALGNSETSGPDGATQITTARTWTGGTWTVATNKAINTPTLGAELATGALTVGTWYSITATEVNHFFTGCAIGDVFRATATTALDANNKVKALTTAELFASLTDNATASIVAGVDIVCSDGKQAGIIVNLDSTTSPDDFIIAYLDGTDLGAGTTRILLDECVNGVYANKVTVTNATYVSGARLVVVRNGTECRVFYNNIVVGTVQTMTANTNTKHGLFSTNASNTFDNFLVMPRGTGGEYYYLDRFLLP